MAGYEYFPDCFAEPERFRPGDRSRGSYPDGWRDRVYELHAHRGFCRTIKKQLMRRGGRSSRLFIRFSEVLHLYRILPTVF